MSWIRFRVALVQIAELGEGLVGFLRSEDGCIVL